MALTDRLNARVDTLQYLSENMPEKVQAAIDFLPADSKILLILQSYLKQQTEKHSTFSMS